MGLADLQQRQRGPGLLGLGTNMLNVGLQWKMFQEAKAKQDERLGKVGGL